jgi:hypothetical protein
VHIGTALAVGVRHAAWENTNVAAVTITTRRCSAGDMFVSIALSLEGCIANLSISWSLEGEDRFSCSSQAGVQKFDGRAIAFACEMKGTEVTLAKAASSGLSCQAKKRTPSIGLARKGVARFLAIRDV